MVTQHTGSQTVRGRLIINNNESSGAFLGQQWTNLTYVYKRKTKTKTDFEKGYAQINIP